MTELRLQQECFTWHWNTYPSQRGLLFRIKNEGLNKISGARGKATGIIPGVADMCLLRIPTGPVFHITRLPVFLEFKSETGKQSPVQEKWQKLVNFSGYQYYTIRSLNQFKKLCHQLAL